MIVDFHHHFTPRQLLEGDPGADGVRLLEQNASILLKDRLSKAPPRR
jgi:hypothetical protein